MTAATRGHTARHTEGRRRASRARPTGTNGTAATDHTAGAGAEDKRREGRKGGRREGHGWPRAWRVEEGITAAGRERTGRQR